LNVRVVVDLVAVLVGAREAVVFVVEAVVFVVETVGDDRRRVVVRARV